MKISNELAKEAKKKGICQDWYLELKNETNIDSLLKMYVKGIDFCLSNDYPSNDYIRKNFKGKMEAHGIHLDENLNEANSHKVIALGECTGNVEINEFNVCEIFLKHKSKINVNATKNAFVMIDMFDDTLLTLTANGNAKVCINHYGGVFELIKSENAIIKVIEKNKKTY